MSLAGRSAVIDMWPYRTIGKTCMHAFADGTPFLLHGADCRRARWYAKAAASPVLPHARVPSLHNVHFAGAYGVLRLLTTVHP
jgi:hypothetical protein